MRKAEEKTKRLEKKQGHKQNNNIIIMPENNSRQNAGKRDVRSETTTVSEGTSASKKGRSGDAYTVSLQHQ